MTSTTTYKVNRKVIVLLTSDDQNNYFFQNNTQMQYLHVNSTSKIFPSLFTYQPGTIIIDCDYLQNEVQDLVRRIRTNPFYNKLKICCLKQTQNHKADEQLKIIGVDFLLYRTSSALSS
ncbi:hypothetical protein KXQ82_18355 [Mucilaginibacter sp. HMF5004]|uniref:hypothetical protein n=1 Tax=Mucilaginibacter rivuli TaxID=2857527 RepID=UPI001C5E6801|nr:hypothetical protein [Mucilaginibacter rivuli]MBW4891693.1 hypothetical protein [Mucilaginibacter rivuli]